MNISKKQRSENIKKNIEALRMGYPKVFNDKRKPLKIGIHKDILGENPTQTRIKELELVLKVWCCHFTYLKNIILEKNRYSLNGEVSGEIKQSHKNIASRILKKIRKKYLERKKKQKPKKST